MGWKGGGVGGGVFLEGKTSILVFVHVCALAHFRIFESPRQTVLSSKSPSPWRTKHLQSLGVLASLLPQGTGLLALPFLRGRNCWPSPSSEDGIAGPPLHQRTGVLASSLPLRTGVLAPPFPQRTGVLVPPPSSEDGIVGPPLPQRTGLLALPFLRGRECWPLPSSEFGSIGLSLPQSSGVFAHTFLRGRER